MKWVNLIAQKQREKEMNANKVKLKSNKTRNLINSTERTSKKSEE